MPELAVRLSGVSRVRGYATQHVHAMGDGLKVVRIDTSAIAAQMVYLQAIGDRAIVQFIRDSMRRGRYARPQSDESVALIVLTAEPLPAVIRLFGLRPKSLFKRSDDKNKLHIVRIAPLLVSPVVQRAVAKCFGLALATIYRTRASRHRSNEGIALPIPPLVMQLTEPACVAGAIAAIHRTGNRDRLRTHRS